MTHHHNHDHNHNHHHHHENTDEPSFKEKMVKRIEHWLKHNMDHADTYLEWAQKARENHMPEIAGYLDEAAEKSTAMDAIFEKALEAVNPSKTSV